MMPIVTCAIITNKHQEFLFIKRKRQPYSGYWSLISGVGASRKGQASDKAIVEEVKYDIGASFDGNLAFTYALNKADYANEVHVYTGEINGKIIPNPNSVMDYRWVTLDNVPTLGRLAFRDSWIITQMFRGR